jgi:hypothetical protein
VNAEKLKTAVVATIIIVHDSLLSLIDLIGADQKEKV